MTKNTDKENRMGEIVESSAYKFVVESYNLFQVPPLGSLVKTGTPKIYAITHAASTGATDPGRPIIARGAQEENEEALFENNPQLSRLLSTQFHGLIVGHAEDNKIHQYLPPQPPPVHGFVYICNSDEITEFTAKTDFMHIILSSNIDSIDEVISACLRQASKAHSDSHAFLVQAGKKLAKELGMDMGRLNAILGRLQ